MSLLEQQHILARLYTDADFRHRFLKDPTKIGAESGLHANEIAEIASIAPELKFFSESLIAKRLNEAAKMLPVLRRLLAAKFHPAFVAFAPTFNPRSLKKHFEDAIEFCSFIDGDSGY
ncbi:MAG TPA: hypothetical protein VJV05_16535, partial [Pyrinomonadaceae bacterium]|nr:hypothetical protein [Pyrinomonadaceae bacterium]